MTAACSLPNLDETLITTLRIGAVNLYVHHIPVAGRGPVAQGTGHRWRHRVAAVGGCRLPLAAGATQIASDVLSTEHCSLLTYYEGGGLGSAAPA